MASDDKKTNPNPAQKNELSPKKQNEVSPKKQDEAASKNKDNLGADLPKIERGEKAAESTSSYSRGEGQKPVSKAYKDNWNAIYGKKKR
jgi:hypothetical protein